jgi:hypothetical protein
LKAYQTNTLSVFALKKMAAAVEVVGTIGEVF